MLNYKNTSFSLNISMIHLSTMSSASTRTLHWFVLMPFESTGLNSYYPATNIISLAKLCPRRYVLLNTYFLAHKQALVSYV